MQTRQVIIPPVQGGRGTRTVLFTDMVGSTALRTRLGDDAADIVREEHERLLRSAIEENGGTVVKVMGDGLMAVFDGAASGLAAGVAVQRAAHWQAERAGLPIQIRVGLSAGDVTWDADDYHGTPVVEAARLEPKAAPGAILASESVRMLAGSRTELAFSPVGPFELKGLPGPVTAYEIAWSPDLDTEQREPPLLTACEETPFVGREEELKQLVELWRATEPKGLRLAFVTGEAGIGKSRLAVEAARAASRDGATVLTGRCDDELDVPYQPFVEALRFFVDQRPSAYVRADLGSAGGELVRLVPELADRFADLSPTPATDPETARYRLFEAISAWLDAASASSPIVFVVDDLQWASKATLLLVRHVARSNADMHVLMVATWRNTDEVPGGSLDSFLGDATISARVTKIALGGLDRGEVSRYVEQTLERSRGKSAPTRNMSERIGDLLHRKSEGNPLFVQELTRDLLDLGVAELDLDRDMLGRLGVPETVRDIVLRRVGRLDEQTQRVIMAAAVAGMQFEIYALERVLDLHGDEVIDALDIARIARLVRERAQPVGSFEFEHGLVRDVLYAEFGVTRRARLHARIATEMEAIHGDELDSWAAEIATHLVAGGRAADQGRAADLLARAGEVAIRSLSYEQAVTMFERALAIVESAHSPEVRTRLRLLLALGDAKFRILDYVGSKKAFVQVIDLARQEGQAVELAQGACGLARSVQPGEPDPLLGHLLDEAIDVLPHDDSYLHAQLLAIRAAHSLQNTGLQRPDMAEEAVSMAQRLGDPGELAFVVGASVIATFAPDLLEQRLGYINMQLESSDASGHLEAACEAYGWRATSMIESGRLESVHSDVESMQRIADETGQPWYRAMAQQRRAMVAQLSGDYATAEALANESLSAVREQQMALIAGYAGLTWAIRRDQGRLSEVEPALVDFSRLAPDVPAWQSTLAVTALELGRVDEARASLQALVAKGLESIPRDWLWLATMVLASEVAAEVAELELVQDLSDLLRPYEGRGVPVAIGVGYLGTTSRVLGLLASRIGDHGAAVRDLRNATEIEERLGAPAYDARAKVALARILLERGEAEDSQTASELLHEADRIAQLLALPTIAAEVAALRRSTSAGLGTHDS
jgi:class 3 adenylate cyclase/tetratricopeptide (TPR) repeat protein